MKDALAKASLPLGDAVARRQRQGRRLQDRRHHGAEHRAAGLFRRRRRQSGAADVQGAQQAVRAGVLVARSRRQPAQQWRQPQHRDARHQRPDFAGRHQERRQQSGATAQGARRSRACRHHRHHHLLRSRLLDDLKGEQDQPVGEEQPTTDTPKDFLPMGFLAIDLAKALDLPLFDPNDKNARRRRQCPSQGRQRPARQGSRKARSRGRHQWRIGPDLSAEQGQETGGAHRQGAARTGLCQRHLRRRRARHDSPARCRNVAARPARARR